VVSVEKSKTGSEIPAAEKLRLLNLVSYQEGAVVSRTLLNRVAGTITLFAFDEGQGLSEHTTPYVAVVQVLEGEADITISGKPLRVMAGEMILLPVSQPHALSAITKFKMLLTMIRST
jgi:quercetin dioxygenase-like cupin family protein